LVTYLDDADRGRSIELRSPVDGSKILSLRAVPFGKKRERLVLARDVTRTRLADDAAEDFVASVSHELRTPLTVISGFLEELSQSTGDDEEIARALELTREQTTRMNTIVQDLLEFSRLQMDTPAAGRAPVPVPAILERAAEEARALSAGRGHLVELEIDPELEIDGNEELLRSAFTNLVVNAVHHTPPRTTIAIRWWRDAAGAHLGVRDNGEGIAARHIPRLTERFYRVDPSRSRRTGGTGLGLAIVKHALERHGAELQIESAAGTGSSFTCHFPDQVVIAPERVPDS
jgi:two-component system phosphate regulon sensor histidine kinase PhoR